MPSIAEFVDDLPSIDDFLDNSSLDLPPTEDFIGTGHGVGEAVEARATDWFDEDEAEDGWAATGWQHFDWSGAASLGVRSEPGRETESAWDALDWHVTPTAAFDRPGLSSADEVARVLDGIAKRIRSGELVIDQLSGAPPEAAMAAALAAVLRRRE